MRAIALTKLFQFQFLRLQNICARLMVFGLLPALSGCGEIAEGFGFDDGPGNVEIARIDTPKLDKGKTLRRIGFGSCADQTKSQAIWTTLLNADPDAFVFMGDNVYGDVTSPDLRELIGAYNDLSASRPFTRFADDVPVLPIWDDHDYGLNDGGADFEYRELSGQIFLSFWDVDGDDPRRSHDGLYRSFIAGDEGMRVQIILLDTRSFRSPWKKTDKRNAPGKERYVPDDDPSKTMLGAAQWQWLEEELKYPADLRIIVSSIQVIADGHGWERWGNLPRERAKLFETIKTSGADGVVLLSGDRHMGGLYKYDDGLRYPIYEVTSSSLNLPLRGMLGKIDRIEEGPYRLQDPYFDANFGMIEIDWEVRAVQMQLRNEAGTPVQAIRFSLDDLKG